MILDRLYKPERDELIYHYCPPEAFLEIVRSRTIWHSAYSVLNDSMERAWGYQIFLEVTERLKNEVENQFADQVKEIVKASYENSFAMISSYSLDGDVLSQWRAYADDGRGFAIGFSANEMDMPAKPLRVLYDRDAQIAELTGNLRHTYEYEKSIGFKFDDQFRAHWFTVGLDLCAYKNPGFAEEMEIRRVHVSSLARQEKSARIVPLGAINQHGGRLAQPVQVNFRSTGSTIVPYVILDYSNGGKCAPIKEVLLGPKNKNLESNIDIFLGAVGLSGVALKRSRASYR
jgi:Protein of unknown function (DUF2971)